MTGRQQSLEAYLEQQLRDESLDPSKASEIAEIYEIITRQELNEAPNHPKPRKFRVIQGGAR